jgi:NarL family two-component system sensor histidine kinase YdfH
MYQIILILLAEAVAVLRSARAHVAAGVAAIGIASLAGAVFFGPAALPRAFMHTVPMAASIVAAGALFQRQVKARSEAQAALAALDGANRRLVEYASEVERLTVEQERQRLARELHDTLAQGLVGIVLQLEAIEAHVERGDGAKAAAIVRHARDRARAALGEARSAISDLRDGGAASLYATIRDESERFSAASGIPCAVSVPSALHLPEAVTGQAIRCVAEGLANVARHSRATRATVSVVATGGALLVELSDDGIGFDVAAAEARPGHFGLLGLRERARLAGGELEIASRPGAGTVLRLRLPHAAGGVRA